MKANQGRKGFGNLLILLAICGIIFSVLGIGLTWYFKPMVQESVFVIVDLLDQIFINTEAGLVVVNNALGSAISNLDTISSTLVNLNTTIDSISDSLNSSADLIGGDLRLTLIDTQTALSSASSSAGLVDNTLRFIASIPLLGADYRPEVPLSESLQQVSDSMSEVPEAFLEIEQYILETESGMVNLKSDITELANEIEEYEQDLLAAKTIISEYDLVIEDLREQLSDFRKNSTTFFLIASLILTGGFFFLGVSQISVIKQTIDYRRREQVTVNLADLQRE